MNRNSALPPVFAENRRIIFIGIVASALFQGGLAVLIAFQTRAIFAAFGEQETAPLQALAILMLSAVLIIALRIAERALGDMLGYDYVKTTRVKLFNHISRLPSQYLQSHKQGSLQIRFVGDLSAIQNWVGSALPGLISAALLLPGLLFLLYWLHPAMALSGLILVSSCVIVMFLLSSALQRFHQDVRSKRGGIASYVASRLNQAPLLRVMGIRPKLSDQIIRRSNSLQSSAVKKSCVTNAFKGIPDLFLHVLYLSCVLLAFVFGMSAAEAAVILAVIAIFHQPFVSIADFWDKRSAFIVSRRKCQELLSMQTISKGKKLTIRSDEIQHIKLELKELSVNNNSYTNVTISDATHTLISGNAGAGKTSLLKVLLGISDPESGNVFINGTAAARLSERTRHRLFCLLDIETPIFSQTIKQTLLFGVFGKPDISELNRAIELFELSALVERLGGLKGKVLENGKNLSRGEIARIACCRAWLSKSRFVLIDDIDVLLVLTGHRLIRLLLQKTDTTIIACSKDYSNWCQEFPNHYNLKPLPLMLQVS